MRTTRWLSGRQEGAQKRSVEKFHESFVGVCGRGLTVNAVGANESRIVAVGIFFSDPSGSTRYNLRLFGKAILMFCAIRSTGSVRFNLGLPGSTPPAIRSCTTRHRGIFTPCRARM